MDSRGRDARVREGREGKGREGKGERGREERGREERGRGAVVVAYVVVSNKRHEVGSLCRSEYHPSPDITCDLTRHHCIDRTR